MNSPLILLIFKMREKKRFKLQYFYVQSTTTEFDVQVTVHRDKFLIINQLDVLISQIYFRRKCCMFRTVPLSIIRSFFTVHTEVVYVMDQDETSWSCLQAVSKPVWHIPLLYVQWKTPDDGQRNYPKHVVSFQNKFEKLVQLVGLLLKKIQWKM
jgi:hypothetical protein